MYNKVIVIQHINLDKNIYIVLAAEDSYSQHLGVMLYSLFENKENNTLVKKVFVLDGSISKKNKAKLNSLILHYNSLMQFINIDKKIYKKLNLCGKTKKYYIDLQPKYNCMPYFFELKSTPNTFDKNELNFDLIFIDGDHEYDGVKSNHEHALQNLKKGRNIIFHDISSNGCPGVVKFWKEIKKDGQTFKLVISNSCGIGIIKPKLL